VRIPKPRRLLVVAAIGLLCACSGSPDRTTLNVFAAASLSNAFTDIETVFEVEHPDVDVVLNLAASSALATQISEGAPAHVFASADEANMNRVADLMVDSATIFATNRLQIVTEAGNPLGIETLADLADPSVLFVTSAVEVPIGRYTAEVLTRAELTVRPVSLEESVKGIVTKVSTGEADAGIVYATDAAAAHPRVTSVNIADEFNVIARYPIAALSTSDAATRFVTFIRSDEGQAILREFGFGSP
jgi:molybdate transport system substrate-binding protein